MSGQRKALFLDRDGVINVHCGYVCRPEEFEFVDGIFDLCRAATERDYLVVVVTNQAGIGGTQAYGRPGVLELGGSFGFNAAADYRAISITPSIGWFFVDNLELSGLLTINNIKVGSASSTLFSALVEPSMHLPLNNALFVFGGLGLGVQHADGPGTGFAVVPRLGLNMMVGRSGVFTPALTFGYSTTDAIQTNQGTLLAVSTTYGLNAGYTVMW